MQDAPARRGIPVLPVAILALLLLLPMLLTPVVPGVDYYAHVFRYHILADNGETARLAANYTPDWKLLPNLGLDVLATGLLAIFPPLVLARLLAAGLVLGMVGSVLFLARAAGGTFPFITLMLACFTGYSHIFIWGFSNFLLGLILLLTGLGLWLKLAPRPGLQLAVAVALGILLMLVHALAFAIWGLLLAAIELETAHRQRDMAPARLMHRAIRLGLVAGGPFAIFLSSRTAEAPQGVTSAFGSLAAEAERGTAWDRIIEEGLSRLDLFLRVADSLTPWADRAIGIGIIAILATGLLSGALRLQPGLRLAVVVAALLAVLAPPSMFGSAYVNDRMPLVLLALVAAAVRPARQETEGNHTIPGSAFTPLLAMLLAAHLILVSASFWSAGRLYGNFRADLARLGPATGETAAALYFRGIGRAGLLPQCSPLLHVMALDTGTAAHTFANPTQQPLRLNGPLASAMEKRQSLMSPAALAEDRVAASMAHREQRIAALLDAGFSVVLACDAGGLPATGGRIERLAGRGFWGLYRLAPPQMADTASRLEIAA